MKIREKSNKPLFIDVSLVLFRLTVPSGSAVAGVVSLIDRTCSTRNATINKRKMSNMIEETRRPETGQYIDIYIYTDVNRERVMMREREEGGNSERIIRASKSIEWTRVTTLPPGQ